MAHDHGHAHSHSHGHGHVHVHGDSRDARRRVALAAGLTFAFMLAEVIGGLISGSLALLADAAHMLTDAGALALAWIGFRRCQLTNRGPLGPFFDVPMICTLKSAC